MKKRPFIGQYRLCDLLTMCSTLSAVIGMILCFKGHTNLPFLLLVVCCICDCFDGTIARRRKNTEFETSYGVELDSLSDMIAFGVFPAIIALTTVKYSFIMYILPLYVLAGLVRLTYFNALNINKMAEKGFFRGVPITAISLVYPLFYFIKLASLEAYSICTIVLFITLGILFVTNIRVKKPNLEVLLSKVSKKSDKKIEKKTKILNNFIIFPILVVILSDLFYKINSFKGIAIIDLFKSIIKYPLAFIMIYFIFLMIYLLITGLVKSTRKAKFTLMLIAAIFLLINDLKYIIMLNPIALSDVHFLNVSNMGTAGLYLSKVNGAWIIKTIVKFIVMVLISITLLKKHDDEDIYKSIKNRLMLILMPILILFVFFKISYSNPLFMVNHVYNYDYETVLATSEYGLVYYDQGLYQGIIYNLYASNIHRPDGYKQNVAYNALYNNENYLLYDNSYKKPNIVLILSESFSDVTNVEEIKFDRDIIPNIHYLDTLDGALVTDTHVSTFGGSSVISEWETITSSTNNFNPAGYIAYTAYYHDKNKDLINRSPNIIRLLKDEGYKTKYITPWASESYNSGIVYDLLGITDVKYDLKGHKKGYYLSDEEITKSIVSELNKDKGTPKMLIYATAENHMPCATDKFKHYDFKIESSKLDKENTDLIKCYAQGVYDADKALGNLYNEIQNIDEDTIVIFYGDHLPFITNNKGENAYLLSKYFNTDNEDLNDLRKHTTKGVIFSNYIDKFDKSIKFINLNYLTAYIYSNLDIANNEYFKYVNEARKIVPVFSKTYVYDNNTKKTVKFDKLDSKVYDKLVEFRKVQYYSFYDSI